MSQIKRFAIICVFLAVGVALILTFVDSATAAIEPGCDIPTPTPTVTIPRAAVRDYPGWPDWVEYRWIVIPKISVANLIQPLEICQNEDKPSCWGRKGLYQEPVHATPWQLQDYWRLIYIHRDNWRADELTVGDHIFLYENILPPEEEVPLHTLQVVEKNTIPAEAEGRLWKALEEDCYAIITCHPTSGEPTHRMVFLACLDYFED